MNKLQYLACLVVGLGVFGSVSIQAERLGDFWGTSERESAYYPITDIPLPEQLPLEASSFDLLSDGRLAIGTRRGDIFLVKGVFEDPPQPEFHRYAAGLDEVTSLSWHEGAFYVTQQTEVTRIRDLDGDERGDEYRTLSDVWGFAHYHEFAFGSKVDPEGNIWIALCLSKSYESLAPFRGWALKVTSEGQTIPIASGIRSPCGVGPNAEGVMFYAESQGPWNGSCSLKHLKPGGFMGHPASFNWYEKAPELGPAPIEPNTRSRLVAERERVKELVPYAVVFPYRKMGQQLSGFSLDNTEGQFGPFADQLFIGDYTLGIVMRVTTERVNGVWQGACYPFREGFATGLLANQFNTRGQLVLGGTNRGWPVRGPERYALQRLDWTGETPFEVRSISAVPGGFSIAVTQPVDRESASLGANYHLDTYTHVYQRGYGSPEVDQTTPSVVSAVVTGEGTEIRLRVQGLVKGHVHDFDLSKLRSHTGESLVHSRAYYTLNEIPQ